MHEPSVASPVNTRIATPADAGAIARLHMEALPGDTSDLTPLGRGLVTRFYANAIARGVATVHVAEAARELLGFSMITPDISRLFSRALLAGASDVLMFVLGSNPVGLARAVLAKLSSGTVTVPPGPELVYLAVSSRARGRGVGSRLVDASHAACREQGIAECDLNVHVDSSAALRLYLAKGYVETDRFQKGGRTLCHMRVRLS